MYFVWICSFQELRRLIKTKSENKLAFGLMDLRKICAGGRVPKLVNNFLLEGHGHSIYRYS